MLFPTMSTFRDMYEPKVVQDGAFDPSRLIVGYLKLKGRPIPPLYARGPKSSGYPAEAFENMALDDTMKTTLRQINSTLRGILVNERLYERNDAEFFAFLIDILRQVLCAKAKWWNHPRQESHVQLHVIVDGHKSLCRPAASLRFNVKNGAFEVLNRGKKTVVLRQPAFRSLSLRPHPNKIEHMAYIHIRASVHLLHEDDEGHDDVTDVYLRGIHVRNTDRVRENENNVGFNLLDLFANYDWTNGGVRQGH